MKEICDCSPELQEAADNLELYIEGDVLYQSMLASIASAQRRIQLESYIFADDEVGKRFVEALVERAQAGVDVQVHIDAAGSLFIASNRLVRDLRKRKVRLRWFHRWSWRKPLRYNRRNHRKLLVVDERIAYLGGFNIHRESSQAAYGEHRWRDSHVRFGGPLAAQAAHLFDRFWQGDHRWMPPKIVGASSELMTNHSRDCREQLRCIFTDMFSGAEHSIHLTTPYFIPDRRTQRLLNAAASRGVDVRLLVPHKGDIRIARWAAQAAYAGLLDAGVRIYEYLPRMLHAKTIVADDCYATVGTANLDYRSFFVNYELNLFTRDPVLCQNLRAQFQKDLEEAEEITARQWKRRFWGDRLFELIGWLARRWL
ncbi:Cardiolipin synthetase [hydrothermal vent metagenome]|uniref:Cardiolipin synthetase n=1 Tax=hydrothermal vent metagenome TaxID=652676 RepID=A0A3B0Y3F2_9ZZZZ